MAAVMTQTSQLPPKLYLDDKSPDRDSVPPYDADDFRYSDKESVSDPSSPVEPSPFGDDKPHFDEKGGAVDVDRASIYTLDDDKINAALPRYTSDFTGLVNEPAKILSIDAKGKALIRLPTGTSGQVIMVTYSDGNIAYLSTRSKSNRRDFSLSNISSQSLVNTKYFNGPTKSPSLRLAGSEQETLSVKTHWPSRRTGFLDNRNGNKFEWRYQKNAKDTNGKTAQVLCLFLVERSENEPPKEVLLASMVRGVDTRAPGSSKTSAGNGGQLMILGDAARYLEEELIVSTCLLMLKREVERRRTYQALSTAAVVALIL